MTPVVGAEEHMSAQEKLSSRHRRRCRRRMCQGLFFLAGSVAATTSEAFIRSDPRPYSRLVLQNGAEEDIESPKILWRDPVQPEVDGDNEAYELPTVPSLDREGPLPRGSYVMLGNSEEAKLSCRIGVNLPRMYGGDEDADALAGIRSCLESGFTTFQSSGSSNDLLALRHLRRDLPLWRDSHLVVPWSLPSSASGISAAWIRQSVLQLVDQIGGDALDTLAIQFQPDSPYHLDVLDVIHDLQRDGHLRSMALTSDWPHALRETAGSCGWDVSHVELSQPHNLLHPYSGQRMEGDNLYATGPLAGGLLTDRHYQLRRFERTPERSGPLTASEQWHMSHSAASWREAQNILTTDSTESLLLLQSNVLPVVQTIAKRHGVSMASVVLRWSLQNEPSRPGAGVQGTWISSNNLHTRARDWRQVFTFALEADDLELLRHVSGERTADPEEEEILDEEEQWLRDMVAKDSGLLLPNSSRTPKKTNAKVDIVDLSKRKWMIF